MYFESQGDFNVLFPPPCWRVPATSSMNIVLHYCSFQTSMPFNMTKAWSPKAQADHGQLEIDLQLAVGWIAQQRKGKK